MADEPSIDEILASLDKLLRESDSGNDDAASAARQSPAAADESLEALESSLAEVLGTPPRRPGAKKPAQPQPAKATAAAKQPARPAPPKAAAAARKVTPAEAVKEPPAGAKAIKAAAAAADPLAEPQAGAAAVKTGDTATAPPKEPPLVPAEVAAEAPQTDTVAATGEGFEFFEAGEAQGTVDEAEPRQRDDFAAVEVAGEAAEEPVAEPEPEPLSAQPRPPLKLVLTEAMLIEDNQSELPFSNIDSQPGPDSPHDTDSEVALAGDIPESAEPPDEWIEMVGQRVVDRLEMLLPRLIREAMDEVGLPPRHQPGNNEKDSEQ